jgi:hypothetical protein
MKAISIPEKNAEKIRDKTIMIISGSTIACPDYLGVAQTSYDSFFGKKTFQ